MKTQRGHSYLTPFRTIFLVLLIAFVSGAAKARTKAGHLYLLAGTPIQQYEEDSYPVTLYAVGSKGQLEAVRQIFSKKQGLYDVRDDLEGRLYVMNQWQNVLSVIHESDPERVDTVKHNFGGMDTNSWGVVSPPGQVSSLVLADGRLLTVSGSRSVTPRAFEGQWSSYQWFRYRGAPVTPRGVSVPVGFIVNGKILFGAIWNVKGAVSGVPPSLPPSVGAHELTIVGRTSHTLGIRTAAVVVDTSRFFAFAALPIYEKKWPVSIYVQNKTTERWKVITSPFVRLWPRVFGSWLATTVEEPNPAGKQSPGVKNERTLPPYRYAYMGSDFPQVRGLYGTKTYMPGKLLLENLVDGRKLTLDTGQQDSEILHVRKDGLVLYRVNDEIFSAHIEGDKLSAPKLVVKGEDVPEVHWVFWSNAGTQPHALAAGAPHQKKPFTLTLEEPTQPLKAGQPLILHVKVKNTSDHTVHIPISRGSYDVGKVYRVHIIDERGRPAPPWIPPPLPKGETVLRIGSDAGTQLKPGESLKDRVNVSHLYNLGSPGKYKIWIAQPFYRGPHGPKGLVRSNTVTVTVAK